MTPATGITATAARVSVEGVPFRPLALTDFLDWLDDRIAEHQGAYVCAVNASCVVQASRDQAFMRALRSSDLNLPDGTPVAWAVTWLGQVHQDRLAGPDVMLAVLRHANERGYRIILYGSTEVTLQRLRQRIETRYAGLALVDAISPPFRPLTAEEESATCERIVRASPDIVFVGLGAPKQEIWMQAHRDKLGAVLIGVGAAFDFHSGHVRRAPELAQRLGLEWAHRIVQEPGRLSRRYAATLPVFGGRLAVQLGCRHLDRSGPATSQRSRAPALADAAAPAAGMECAAAYREATPASDGEAWSGRTGVPSFVLLDTSNADEMTGGQSVFMRNLLPRLDGAVSVVGTTGRREALGRWSARTLSGVPYRFMPVARMPAPGRRPRMPLRLAGLLGVARHRRAILDAGDVMYVHSPEMGLPLALGRARKPIVLHIHGAANPLVASRYAWARNTILRSLYGRVQRHIINASSLVLSVDEAGLQLARENLAPGSTTRLALVPICVDTRLFCPGDKSAARAAHGLEASDKIVTFVGRVEEAKGIEPLVDALALLARRSLPIRLVVIGDGSQRAAMEERARRSGVIDRIVFAGWVEHYRLPAWLQATDTLVLPSAHEGLPTAVLEALACGIPVVATRVGDVPRLVREGSNGLILKERTSEALAQALQSALGTEWSAQDIAASVRDYSADRIAALTSGLLRDAAGTTG